MLFIVTRQNYSPPTSFDVPVENATKCSCGQVQPPRLYWCCSDPGGHKPAKPSYFDNVRQPTQPMLSGLCAECCFVTTDSFFAVACLPVQPFLQFHGYVDSSRPEWKQKTIAMEQDATTAEAVVPDAKSLCTDTVDFCFFATLIKFQFIHGSTELQWAIILQYALHSFLTHTADIASEVSNGYKEIPGSTTTML